MEGRSEEGRVGEACKSRESDEDCGKKTGKREKERRDNDRRASEGSKTGEYEREEEYTTSTMNDRVKREKEIASNAKGGDAQRRSEAR